MESTHVLHGFAIVIADRGFVYVGQTEILQEWCVIKAARNIRKWGTTCGLGQLALEGPRDNTVLDPVGVVRIPMRAVISVIDTEPDKWN